MQKREDNINIHRWGLKLLLVLFDIFAVNFSYYMALVLRFYVNGEFHLAGTLYFPLFVKFAPYYTVCCILIFWFFKLYNGMWRYAGFNDVNRIVGACAVSCAVQIAGTLLFVRRMPITYYAIGAAIQFVLIAASRLSYRILNTEFSRLSQRDDLTANVMVIGAGETARKLLGRLDKNSAKPVCVIDFRNRDTGWLLDGLPVVGGIESMENAIVKYGIQNAVIADPLMPAEVREQVRSICADQGIAVQDVSAHPQNRDLVFQVLLERAIGSLELTLDGKTQCFENSEQAAKAYPGRYAVKAIYGKENRLVIELENGQTVLNNVNETWVQEYEKETGESVSFF